MGRSFHDVAIFALAYFVAAAVPIALTRLDGGVALVWLATALLAAKLRTEPRTTWPLWMGAAGIASFAATGLVGLGWIAAGPMAIFNLIEAFVTASVLARADARNPTGREDDDGPVYILACLLGPLAAVLPAAWVATQVTDSTFLSNSANWLIGHSLGSLAFGPMFYLCMQGRLQPFIMQMVRGRDWRTLGGIMGVMATSVFAFMQSDMPVLFLPILAIIALTCRAGIEGAAIAIVVICVTGAGCTMAGMGPLHLFRSGPFGLLEPGSVTTMHFFQFYMGVTTLVILPVANAISLRSRMAESLRQSEATYRLLADNIEDVVVALGVDGRVRYLSPAIVRHGQKNPDRFLGRPGLLLVDPAHRMRVAEAFTEILESDGAARSVEFIGRDAKRWFELNGRPTRDPAGALDGIVITIRDVSHRKTMEAALACAATTDHLTGLTNRRGFMQAAELAAACGVETCIAVFDLDYFTAINDNFGHVAGDEVLQRFATLARTVIREKDVLARIGGEEFALLLPNTNTTQAQEVCERILARLAGECMMIGGNKVFVTASAGMDRLDGTVGKALRRADSALRLSKRSGRARLSLAA